MSTRAPRAARSAASRLFRSRAGQIVIPAMLMFPTLFLFVYLIYETAKLSREKIRHQFALDAAAFVEMTNYSDFLNRTAYVNGAFPMRIFEEGYGDFPADCNGKAAAGCPDDPKNREYADILYCNGAYPRDASDNTCPGTGPSDEPSYTRPTVTSYSTEPQWRIEYGGAGTGKNSSPPTLTEPFVLFTLDNANKFWHQYDLAAEIYKLWVQVYSLLGSVEYAQVQVLQRLTTDTDHSFLQKSYWLNTGDPPGDSVQLADSFKAAIGTDLDSPSVTYGVCQKTLDFWGNKHLGGTGIQPFAPYKTDPTVQLQDSQGCSGGGLFQIEWVDPSVIKKLDQGLELSMFWNIPSKNYFNYDFAAAMRRAYPHGDLHVTIGVGGAPGEKPSVWPDPTPKFQVRERP
ncbi:MAG: hypothetical protein KGM24_00555 [Elusimicrobia bacterium]|nr:hypothetical protein [Elusimicrobiota bacterium]